MLFHEQLLSIVSQLTGVPNEVILSNSRKRNVTNAKQLYAYFLRYKFHLKLKQISGIMNNDHTSVLHCLKVIENMKFIKDDIVLKYIDDIDTCLVNLEGLNYVRKLKVNVPIHCDIDRLKLALIEEFGCSIEFVYE
jgi:hypothetical protein